MKKNNMQKYQIDELVSLASQYIQFHNEKNKEYLDVLNSGLQSLDEIRKNLPEIEKRIELLKVKMEIENLDVDGIELQVRKLVSLIYSSDMPDDVKESLIFLVSEMSLEQIESLIGILEKKYVDGQTLKVDDEFREKIKNIALDFGK